MHGLRGEEAPKWAQDPWTPPSPPQHKPNTAELYL